MGKQRFTILLTAAIAALGLGRVRAQVDSSEPALPMLQASVLPQALAAETRAVALPARSMDLSNIGVELWSASHGVAGNDTAYGAAVDAQGRVLVAGFVKGAATNDTDAYAIKYNESGGVDWFAQRNSGVADNSETYEDVCVDSGSNVILVGRLSGIYPPWNVAGLVQKYTPDGTLIWERLFDGYAWTVNHGCAVDANDNIYVAGRAFRAWNTNETDWMVLKYDTDGNLQVGFPWYYNYSHQHEFPDVAYSLDVDAAGNVVVAGVIGRLTSDHTWHVRKYASDGSLIWQDSYDGDAGLRDYAYDVTFDSNGDVIATGWTNKGTDNGENADYDWLTIKYSADGDAGAAVRLWTETYESAAARSETSAAVVVDGYGHVVVGGYEQGPDLVNRWRIQRMNSVDGGLLAEHTWDTYPPSGVLGLGFRDGLLAVTGYTGVYPERDYHTALIQTTWDPAIHDCNENGIPDGTDIADGTSLDCNANGIPDECDIADVGAGFEGIAGWSAFDAGAAGLASGLDAFVGGVFDGRYVYFVPHNNDGGSNDKVMRYDTTAPFDSLSSWSAFDNAAQGAGAAGGYLGGVFDGRYVYFVPYMNGTQRHGEVLRYDTAASFSDSASWTVYDPGAHGVGVDADGYSRAIFDGRYVYFAPADNGTEAHGEVLRLDTAGAFTEATSWATFDPGANGVGTDPDGYCGGVFDGRYVYFSPTYNGTITHGEVLRYDTTGDFGDAASWVAFDAGAGGVGVNPAGYYEAVFDGRFVYFIPYYNGVAAHGEFLRYDTTGDFSSAASWSTFNPADAGLEDNPVGYIGGAYDGRFVYFAPYSRGNYDYHGEVLRYDPQGPFDDLSSWASYDPGTHGVGVSARGYQGAVFDGRHIYFVPFRYQQGPPAGHGEVLRYDTFAGWSQDCNGNGVPDECDVTDGTSPDCNLNGTPDECEVPPIGDGVDCQADGVPDECQLAGNDCNTNAVPDECDISDGTSEDCQPNDVPDECDLDDGTSLDCQPNDVPDECDIDQGTSDDVNTDGVPDECQVVFDCNGNGIEDVDDIAAGTSQDCNGNEIPDECETVTTLIDLDFNSGVDSLGNSQGELLFYGGCGLEVVFTDDDSDGSHGQADGVHINNVGYGNIKAGTDDLVIGAYNNFYQSYNYHSSGIVARFNRGVHLVRLDDTDDDTTLKTLFAFDENGTLIGQTSPGSQQTFQIDTNMTGGKFIYSVEFDSAAGTAGGASDGIVFTIDNFHVESYTFVPDRVLMINVHGTSYDADGYSIYTTLVEAGAEAHYVNLSSGGQAATLIQQHDYDQIWVFDLSGGADNYPTDWQAIADWFAADSSRAIVCDGRMISSYWNGRWQTEGQMLTENYYENIQAAGGGLVLGTDHNNFQSGINTINNLIGIEPFFGNFSLTMIPVDVTNPLMNTPNDLGPELWDDSSPGQTPYGLQPNGRILYSVAWHSGNPDTPGISATIEGEIGFHVQITSPADNAEFIAGQPVAFAAAPDGGDPPYTYEWSSDLDGVLGAGETLEVNTLSAGTHEIMVLAQDAQSREDFDTIHVNILPKSDLTVSACDAQASVDAGGQLDVTWTVTNIGGVEVAGSWTDVVYLSEDEFLGDDIELGRFTQAGPLPAGESYSPSESMTVPGDLAGDHSIFVVTDLYDEVEEPWAEDNNSRLCGVTTVNDTMPPDTTITGGPGDGAYINETQATYGWTGSDNETGVSQLFFAACLAPQLVGCDPAAGPFLPDTTNAFTALTEEDSPYVFNVAARDEAGNVDPTPASRVLNVDLTPVWVVGHTPEGVVNERVCSVDVTFSEEAFGFERDDVAMTGPAGDVWITEVVPVGSLVHQIRFACQSEGGGYQFTIGTGIQDRAGNPLQEAYNGGFSIAMPDLKPTALTVEAAVQSGEQIEVRWTVTNNGTIAAAGTWKDRIYLSGDDVWGGDTLLGEFNVSGPLADGTSYDLINRVTIPPLLEGDYWIIVVTDARDAMVEFLENDDNRLVSDVPVAVSLPPFPDLQVTELTGPVTAWPGQRVAVCWTVTNTGSGATEVPFWKDHLFLSSDQSIGGDWLLGRFDNPSSLGAGESYQQCPTVTIPGGALGCYYFLLRTDAYNQVFEYRSDIDAEANNDAGSDPCVDVVLPPPSDLQVTQVNAPNSAWSGETITVDFQVINAGDSPTPVTFWQDSAYLSEDETLDPADLRLCTVSHSGGLIPDGTYDVSHVCALPRWMSGTFYVFVRTDSSGHVGEQGFEDNNDAYDATALTINLTPPPDLEVISLSVVQAGAAPPTAQVDWTVTNYGGSPTDAASWSDAVYLSVDDSFETTGDNTLVGGPYTHSGALEPDQSYDMSKVVSLPTCADQDYYVFVVTDVGNSVAEFFPDYEQNNDDAYQLLSVVTEEPDLEVTNVSAPASASSSDLIPISWDVGNTGSGSTRASSFVDAVYLSSDMTWDAGDQKLADFVHEGSLAALDSYSSAHNVALPPGLTGDYHVIVVTDATDVVAECGSEVNNVAVTDTPISIDLAEADLNVILVIPEPTAQSSEPMNVQWGVANGGTRRTNTASWTDGVYLSADQVMDSGDLHLGNFGHTGYLDPADDYGRSADVVLPAGIEGDYFVFVCTDVHDVVFEAGREADNCASAAVATSITHYEPDLIVEAVVADAAGLSGEPISVEWTVLNAGDRSSGATAWTDAVYLSQDGSFDPAADTKVAEFDHDGILPAGERYSRAESVDLPPALVGTWHVFVCTDVGDDVIEPGNEGNNCTDSGTPLEVGAFEPDLDAFNVSGEASGLSGSPIEVSWSVRNVGERETTEEAWVDRVYLSTNQVLDGEDDLLAEFVHEGALAVVNEYQMVREVTLSSGGAGPRYIIVKTDAVGDVFELGREGNNVAAAPTTTDVICVEPDLRVSEVSAPLVGDSGWPIDVSWTVVNAGNRATQTRSWRDRVYLSQDPDLDTGADLMLGEFSWNDGLGAAGGGDDTYTRDINVTLPHALDGVHYLFVITDYWDRVEECDNEGNNVVETPVAITIGLTTVDLQVESCDTPGGAFAGQPISVSWSIANRGDSVTPATSWRDGVYLSLDLILDPVADVSLGSAVHAEPLGPGITEPMEASFTVPRSTAPGDYYVLVWTDQGDDIYEHEAESNNRGASAGTLTVAEAPEADLVVAQVIGPFSASPGQAAEFRWTVTNNGANDALGRWFDSIYLSTDQTWDLDDVLVAKVQREGPVISGGGSYEVSLMATLPGVLPGPQYAIVRCDINNQIPEGAAGEGNNMGVSSGTTDVQMVELTLGVPFDSELLVAGEPHYYQVTVAPDETLRVTVDAESTTGANELYIRYDEIPDRGHYDDSHDNPFLPDQRVVIPTTQAGTYYVLVSGNVVPDPPEPYTILAESVPFGIDEVDPDFGSNTAAVTIEITGARFEQDTDFTLTGPDAAEIEPDVVYPQDASVAFATFDLTGHTPGAADVGALNPDSSVATAEAIFEILPGGGPQVSARVTAPASVREGRSFMMRVEYGNVGKADMPAPLLELRASRHLSMALKPDGPYYSSPIRILGVNFNGPAGVLPPGRYGAVPIYVRGTSGGGTIRIGVVHLTSSEVIDWEAEEARIRPDGVTDAQWAAVYTRFTERMGETWGEFESALAALATQFWLEARRVHDVELLVDYELERAWAMYPSAISGTVLDGETLAPLAGARLVAASTIDFFEDTFETLTEADGTFELELPAAPYELSVEGYYLEPPVAVELDVDDPATGLTLYAFARPIGQEPPPDEPIELPDAAPALGRDANGGVHMVWHRGEEAWHARFDGAAWANPDPIGHPDGGNFQIGPAPAAEGADAITITFTEGYGDDAEIKYTVGKPDAGDPQGYVWSNPIALTDDEFADQYPAFVLTADDTLIVVHLKKLDDGAVPDDTDVYYHRGAFGPLDWSAPSPETGAQAGADEGIVIVPNQVPIRLAPQDGYPGAQESAYCQTIEFKFAESISFPEAVAGDWGVAYKGQFCGSTSGCKYSTGSSDAVEFLMGRRKAIVQSSGKDDYVVDKEKCDWAFSSGERSFGGGAEFKVSMGPIIVPALGIPIPGSEWGFELAGSLNGTLHYDAANPPDSWTSVPSSGSVTVGVGVSPYGEVDLSRISSYLEGKATIKGSGSIKVTISAPKWDGKIEGCFGYSWGISVGIFQYGGSDEWCWPQSPMPQMFREDFPEDALVFTEVQVTPDGEGVRMIASFIEVEPLVGTGAVYPGNPVLADVGSDLTNDGPPAMAQTPTGEVVAIWTKDADEHITDPADPDPAIGSAIVVSTFGGSAWGEPTELVDHSDFNGQPALSAAPDGNLMAVWSTASATGYSIHDTVETLLDAMARTDLVYARRVGGVWSSPVPVVAQPGSDQDVALTVDDAGRIVAAWVNVPDYESDITAVYAALWDPVAETWGAPTMLTQQSAVDSIDCEFSDGTPVVVWAADADGVLETPDDLTVYHASYDGSSWSTPIALPKETAAPAPTQTPAPSEAASFPDVPDKCCYVCVNDSECDDGVPCTEDRCVDHNCKAIPRDEECDDGKFCNGAEKCDAFADCVEGSPPCPSGAPCDENQDACGCSSNSDCDDGINCTDDVCENRVCKFLPIDEFCSDDLNWCNGEEYCDPQKGCTSTGPPCPINQVCDRINRVCTTCEYDFECRDDNPCTADSCDNDQCRHVPDDSMCQDGNACNGTEVCDPASGCRAGVPLDCGFDDECAHRWCDPEVGCMDVALDCNNGPFIEVIRSFDPNEKIAPDGFGEQHWVKADENLFYTILFENLPDATAPAQVVTITDVLSEHLDWRTFRVLDVGWGDRIVEAPGNRSYFQSEQDLVDEIGLLIRINAGIDVTSGLATWTFTAVDPETGELPAEAGAGFLPPNDPDVHDGEGFVNFTIRPKRNLSDGTVITNDATIVFDVNEPIDTNEVLNTVDGHPPASAIDALPAQLPGPEILLTWSAEDVAGGSGLAGVTVFVSIDGGPYEPFISHTLETSTVFNGQPSHSYAFYSVASDNAGNVELSPPTPDAVTSLPSALQVDAIIVNGGLTQRSNLTDVRVEFTTATGLQALIDDGTITDAVAIRKRPGGSATVGPAKHFIRTRPMRDTSEQSIRLPASHYQLDPDGRVLTIDLTVDGFGGAARTLLEEGNYELRLNTEMVESSLGLPLADADGEADGLHRFGHHADHLFFRLAGDGNADRVVDTVDLDSVRDAWLTGQGDPGFDPDADMNSDGLINFLDLQIVRYNWLAELGF